MQILALDRSDRTAVLMFATALSTYGDVTPPCEVAANEMYGDVTPPCERAANDTSAADRDPPPRPAASAMLPRRWTTLRLAA